MASDVFLNLQGVSKVYPGIGAEEPVVALDTLDLEVRRGELLAVVGESGCGKSTLIDLVAGFSRPTAGSIKVSGREVTEPGPERIVVFQDHAVFPWYTARDNVAYGLRCQGFSRKDARREAQRVLEKLGLGDFLTAYPATLSGGMRQRVALARSLVLRPEILLLDEPFAALDTLSRRRLQVELLQLWEEYGWTVVFVTHDLREAIFLADRILVLKTLDGGWRLESIGLPRPRERRGEAVERYLGMLWRCMHGETRMPEYAEGQITEKGM